MTLHSSNLVCGMGSTSSLHQIRLLHIVCCSFVGLGFEHQAALCDCVGRLKGAAFVESPHAEELKVLKESGPVMEPVAVVTPNIIISV